MKLSKNFVTIKKAVKKFAKKHLFLMFALALAFISIVVAVPVIGTAEGKGEDYETNIVFDKNNPFTLALAPKTVKVHPGMSKEDMDKVNRKIDPEAIKVLMQDLAPDYGVDWKLVYAIGYHESGNYSSALAQNNYNFFGRKAREGGYAKWSTPEEGVRNQFEYLKTRYFDRGMDTPAKINPVYAEDSTWHYRVEAVMASL